MIEWDAKGFEWSNNRNIAIYFVFRLKSSMIILFFLLFSLLLGHELRIQVVNLFVKNAKKKKHYK